MDIYTIVLRNIHRLCVSVVDILLVLSHPDVVVCFQNDIQVNESSSWENITCRDFKTQQVVSEPRALNSIG